MSSGWAAYRPPALSSWSLRAQLVAAALVWATGTGGPVAAAASAPDSLVDEKAGAVVDWRRGMVEATGGGAADPRMPSAEAARPGAERRARAAARARLAELLKALPLGGGRRLDEAAVGRALARARTIGVDYQSNGGAVVRLAVAFGDWSDAPATGITPQPAAGRPQQSDAATAPDAPPQAPTGSDPPGNGTTTTGHPNAGAAAALAVSEAHLAAAPFVVVGGREVMPASARYLTTAELPPGLKPLVARADKRGRLLIATDGKKSSSSPGVSREVGEDAAAKFAGKPLVVYVHKILR